MSSTQADFNTVAETFIESKSEDGARMMNIEGSLYWYKDGVWRPFTLADDPIWNRQLLDIATERNFPYSKNRSSLWATIYTRAAPLRPITLDARPMIVCKNGTLDLMDRALVDHSPDHYCTRSVDVEFDSDAECPEWMAMLERIFQDYSPSERKEIITYLQEYFGVSIVSDPNRPRALRKALVLYGNRGTGKTTIGEVLRTFFGESRTSSMTLESLSRQYGAASLLGSLALISDDAVDKRTKPDTMILKKLITGEVISVERKFKDAAQMRWHGPVMFTTNNLPKIDDETDALFDRMTTIPVNHVFSDEDSKALKGMQPWAYLGKHGEYPGILNWAIDGYIRATDNRVFTQVKVVQEASVSHRRTSDVVFDFLHECTEYDSKVYNRNVTLAAAAVEFAAESHNQKISPNYAARAVGARLKEVYPAVRTDKQASHRGYTGIRLNDKGLAYLEKARETNVAPLPRKADINVATV